MKRPVDLSHYPIYYIEAEKKYYDRFNNPIYLEDLTLETMCQWIRDTRKQKKLTQEQLGVLVGVQKSQIAKIENARKDIKLTTLLKVFDALKVKVRVKFD